MENTKKMKRKEGHLGLPCNAKTWASNWGLPRIYQGHRHSLGCTRATATAPGTAWGLPRAHLRRPRMSRRERRTRGTSRSTAVLHGMMAAAPSPLPTPGMRRMGHVRGSLQRL